MAGSKKKLGEAAAEATTAFNPIVGVHRSELVKSLGIVLKQAALNPTNFGQHFLNYSKDMVDIVRGNSDYEANAKDRRFQDRAWQTNPVYKRGMQSWMAMKSNLKNWLDDTDIDTGDKVRAHFILDVVTDLSLIHI